MPLLEGFERRWIEVGGLRLFAAVGGAGDPVLLQHGYPQTHVMWHAVAPRLAERHTVVCPDLRGYGDSAKPGGSDTHAEYAKRAMAADAVGLMKALGFDRFAAVGHDRGGRVVHRLCLDHPAAVTKAAVLDIVPTRTVFETMGREVALGYHHWTFLAQPRPLPERMIGADPVFWLEAKLGGWGTGLDAFHPAALAEYRRCFADPDTIHATCEDYRAAATIDLEHDRDHDVRRIRCPLLVMWGRRGLMERHYDVPATWRAKADHVIARGVDAGHFLAEERPEEVAEVLEAFLVADATEEAAAAG